MAETLGASFSIDVTNLKAGLAQANRLIRESQSEFQAAAAGMDDWSKSEDGLNSKIKSLNQITEVQRKKVEALQGEYDRLIDGGLDPASKEAVELRTKINNETAALNKNEAELKQQTQALEELEKGTKDAGDATEEMGDKFAGLKAAGGVAVGAVAAVGAACVAAVGSFLGLAESTREAREDMAKLESAFAGAGIAAESATATHTKLFSVMGENDTAVEAAQQIALLANSEEQAAKWADQAANVTATFGDALKPETYFESANETLKLGEATGAYAQMLEGTGYSVEQFNEELAACTSEEEKHALMLRISEQQMGKAGDAYRENNADIIAAQEAQANLNSAINELGAIAEPIMTTIKTLGADLLTTLNPFVSLIGDGLMGALNGADDAAENLAAGLTGALMTLVNKIVEMLPFVIDTIVAIVPQLLTELLAQLPAILQTLIDMVIQIADGLTAMLPTIVAAIMDVLPKLINALVASIPQLLEAAIQLLMAIVDAIPVITTSLVKALPSILETTISALTTAIPMLGEAAIQLLMAMVDAIPVIIDALVDALPQVIDAIINGVLDSLPLLLDAAVELLFALVDAIPVIVKELYGALPQIIKTILTSVKNALPKLFETAKSLFGKILTAAGELIKQLPSKMGEVISAMVGGLSGGFNEINEIVIQPILGFFAEMWTGLKDGASELWQSVKDIFSTIATWVDENVIQPVSNFFTETWTKLKDGVNNAWQNVKDIFSTIATWVDENVIQPIWNFLYPIVHNIYVLITGTWEIIKAVFAAVATWFDENVIQPVKQFFVDLWNTVSGAAQTAWDSIVSVFTTVSEWIDTNVIQPVSNFFTGMWTGLKDGAENAWQGIKDTFATVATFFGDIFSGAWQKVKDVFSTGGQIFDGIKEGIVSAFTNIVNAIIRGINKVISVPFDAINTTLENIKNVKIMNLTPFSDLITGFTAPQIPELAAGGVVNKATTAVVGEDGAEAIVPLENNRQWIRSVAEELSAYQKQSVVVNQTNNYSQSHSRYEIYKSKQQTEAAVRLAMGAV